MVIDLASDPNEDRALGVLRQLSKRAADTGAAETVVMQQFVRGLKPALQEGDGQSSAETAPNPSVAEQPNTRWVLNAGRAPLPEAGTPEATGSDSVADPNDATDQTTATAFALSRLLGTKKRDLTQFPKLLGLEGDSCKQVVDTFCADFVRSYTRVLTKETSGGEAQQKNAARELPNPYSSSLSLAGLIPLIRNNHPAVTSDAKKLADLLAVRIATWFVRLIRIEDQNVVADLNAQIDAATNAPEGNNAPSGDDEAHDVGAEALNLTQGGSNAYLTFLCASALRAWHDLPREAVPDRADADIETVESALRIMYATGVADLSRQIAAQQAGRSSLFDAMDVICTLATAALTGQCLDLIDEYHRGLVPAAIRSICERHVLEDGSIAPKGAALATRDQHSVVLSSAELGDILFAASHELTIHDLDRLSPLIESVIRRSNGRRGWGSGADTRTAKPIFVTASSISLLRRFESAIREALNQRARARLGIKAPSAEELAKKTLTTGATWDLFQTNLIKEVVTGKMHRADLSWVLYGPPGTAKTTIARDVARALQWPLLELGMKDFLAAGDSQIDAQAERIFSLLSDLSEVVVLLDEAEGMFGPRDDKSDRQDRFLTTSMLPRLHDLRDLGRIAFIIATNYETRLDAAAIRPGRIDRLVEVLPPDREIQKNMLSNFLKDYGLSHDESAVQDHLFRADTLDRFDNWTVGYLKRVVRDLAVAIDRERESRAGDPRGNNPDSATLADPLSDPEFIEKSLNDAITEYSERYDKEQRSYESGAASGVNQVGGNTNEPPTPPSTEAASVGTEKS